MGVYAQGCHLPAGHGFVEPKVTDLGTLVELTQSTQLFFGHVPGAASDPGFSGTGGNPGGPGGNPGTPGGNPGTPGGNPGTPGGTPGTTPGVTSPGVTSPSSTTLVATGHGTFTPASTPSSAGTTPGGGGGAGGAGGAGGGGVGGAGGAGGGGGGNLPFTGYSVTVVAALGSALSGAGAWIRRKLGQYDG